MKREMKLNLARMLIWLVHQLFSIFQNHDINMFYCFTTSLIFFTTISHGPYSRSKFIWLIIIDVIFYVTLIQIKFNKAKSLNIGFNSIGCHSTPFLKLRAKHWMRKTWAFSESKVTSNNSMLHKMYQMPNSNIGVVTPPFSDENIRLI